MSKISVIVPVYNVQKYLRECLDSIKNQTFSDYEVIIIDDGSPDESYKIYEEYVTSDSRFKVIKKENSGVSEARNTGVEHASGKFLMFVDSDDWLPLNAFDILINAYEETGSDADMVVADIYTFTSGVTRLVHVFNKNFSFTTKEQLEKYQRACIGYGYNPNPGDKWNVSGIGSLWNKLYNRDLIEKSHLKFDPYVMGIYDDNLFTLNFISCCKKIVYTTKPVYYYRIIPESITNSYKENTLEISRRIFEQIKDFIGKQERPEFFVDAFNQYVIRRLSGELGVYYFSNDNPKGYKDIFDELKTNINTEPYKSAIRNVDYRKLMPQHWLTWATARINWAWGMWATFKVRRTVKAILKR